MTEKLCSKCGKLKSIELFYTGGEVRGVANAQCKACENLRHQRHRDRVRTGTKVFVAEKKCGVCKEAKSRNLFGMNNANKDGLHHYCKVCRYAVTRGRTNVATWWFRRCFGKGRAIPTDAVTAAEVKNLYDADPNCFYCRVALTGEAQYDVHVDHKQPRSKGGSDQISNLAIACKDCNRLKHDMTELEFRAFLNVYVKRFQDARYEADVQDWAERGTGT